MTCFGFFLDKDFGNNLQKCMVTIVQHSKGRSTEPRCMPKTAKLESCGTSFTRFGNTTTVIHFVFCFSYVLGYWGIDIFLLSHR